MSWKRAVNTNLLTMIAVILILCLTAGYLGISAILVQAFASPNIFVLDPGEVGEETAEVWAAIAGTMEVDTEEINIAVDFLHETMISLFGCAFIILTLVIVARCVHRCQGRGLLVYRILMGIAYALLVALTAVFFLVFLGDYHSWPFLLVAILFTVIIVWNMVNTYSKRIGCY